MNVPFSLFWFYSNRWVSPDSKEETDLILKETKKKKEKKRNNNVELIKSKDK